MARTKRGDPCVRCAGSGSLPMYNYVEKGVCFRCKGTGSDPGPREQTVEEKKKALLYEIRDELGTLALAAESMHIARENYSFQRNQSRLRQVREAEKKFDLCHRRIAQKAWETSKYGYEVYTSVLRRLQARLESQSYSLVAHYIEQLSKRG